MLNKMVHVFFANTHSTKDTVFWETVFFGIGFIQKGITAIMTPYFDVMKLFTCYIYHKLILFLDRAPQHCRSKRVKAYLEKNNDVMTTEYFPKGSSELSAVEECWRQGKDNLLVSKYYPRFTNLKAAITNYYRTKRFNLNIVKYLLRESANLR